MIILKESGKHKLKSIYAGSVELMDYRKLNLDTSIAVVLSGYPVDLANVGILKTDILANKRATMGRLLFHPTCPMVGYEFFTCSGDSGAPLWVFANGKHYIIGIHHGGPEDVQVFGVRNSAALIRDEVLQLIK